MMLNVGKTDVLTISEVKAAVPDSGIELCGEFITSSRFFRNLGATFDGNLNIEMHVRDICRRAFYHTHRIGLIRNYLAQSATARLVSAFVLSLLDNGNSLLLGLPGKQIDRIQSVQNSAVQLINRTSRMEHITPPVGCIRLAADSVQNRLQGRHTCLPLCSQHGISLSDGIGITSNGNAE
jgi:hypothetical protein